MLFNVGMAVFTLALDYATVRAIKKVINPISDNLLRRFGSREKIQEIYNYICSNIEYQDNKIIISPNYIMIRDNIETLISCEDVVQVYITNSSPEYTQIFLIDKSGFKLRIPYSVNEQASKDAVLSMLSSKCKNAQISY